MKVAILGYGSQGKSAHEYWANLGHEVTICDSDENLEVPENTPARIGVGYLKGLDEFDLLVRSPSIHPEDIVQANNPEVLSKVTSSTNELFNVSPTKNIVAVTGTKGKGTTSTLITKMLEASGKRVHLGGNIGTPPLELMKNNIKLDDWIVLELANFQLIDLHYSPKIAVCLMIASEHLDFHPDNEEYFAAKKQLFAYQKETDVAVYYAENEVSEEIAAVGAGKKIPYYKPPGAYIENDQIMINGQKVCSTREIKLLGKHNWQNVCAAITAFWQIKQNIEAARSIITTFSGMEHRLEFVREVNEVKYYDDSFGTTPETAIVAIEAFEQPKVVILGGSDKGSNYEKLAETIKNTNIRKVVLIGVTGIKIQQELDKIGFSNYELGGKTMPEIVATAKNFANPGDIVLLSTASASFDLFKNYKDRGEKFKQAVISL